MAYLERELVAARYDLKHVYRLISEFATRISSPRSPKANDPEGEANFAHYPPRRLEAEVLIDAICQITGTTEKYSSPIPEPFTFIPEDQRSIALADGSISSSFLEMFGRRARQRAGIGAEQPSHCRARVAFAQFESYPAQDRGEPKLRELLQSQRKPREMVDELYLTILSRFPTDEELKIVRDYAQAGQPGQTSDDGPRLGVDQQRGVSLSALISAGRGPVESRLLAKAMETGDACARALCLISRREAIRRGLLRHGRHCCWPASPNFPPGPRCKPTKAKAKSVIQIWMWGGPSHLDTFDPKPAAGYDYCGPLNKPIQTNVDGIVIGELLPLLAKQADKYSIIRSMTHGNNAHETAAYMVQTGRNPAGGSSSRASAPSSRCSRATAPAIAGLIPPYIVLTQLQGRFSEVGFLPSRCKPFATGGDPAQARFIVEGIVAQGVTDAATARPTRVAPQAETFGRLMEATRLPGIGEVGRRGL